VKTWLTVLLSLVAGLGGAIIAARTAIGDRKTRLQIAKEDRESAHRRDACIALESQRIVQFEYVSKRWRGLRVRVIGEQALPDVPVRNLIADAAVSLVFPDDVLEAVKALNDAEQNFLTSVHEYEAQPFGEHKASFLVPVDERFRQYKSMSEDLRGLLRREATTLLSGA
jgi:hypothetical protein